MLVLLGVLTNLVDSTYSVAEFLQQKKPNGPPTKDMWEEKQEYYYFGMQDIHLRFLIMALAFVIITPLVFMDQSVLSVMSFASIGINVYLIVIVLV